MYSGVQKSANTNEKASIFHSINSSILIRVKKRIDLKILNTRFIKVVSDFWIPLYIFMQRMLLVIIPIIFCCNWAHIQFFAFHLFLLFAVETLHLPLPRGFIKVALFLQTY